MKGALNWLTDSHHIGTVLSAATVRRYLGQLTTALIL